MLSEFVDKILGLAAIQKTEIGGRPYVKDKLTLIYPPEFYPPETLAFRTLMGLSDYILLNQDSFTKEDVFVQVLDFNQVNLFGHLIPSVGNVRLKYASATLRAEPFGFGVWHDLETFIISLQSMFVADAATETLINVLGSLANEHVVENKDDGFSQSLQVKTGITTKSQVKITNPMTFRPYRTFREVEQPASQFIFRMKKGKEGLLCALFESDGGAWKLEAINNIKRWLRTNGAGYIMG